MVFSHIAKTVSEKGKRVLILAHRDKLIRQASKAMDRVNIRHGLISPKYTPDLAASVQIASVQTMAVRLGKHHHKYDLIIIDECHHSTSQSYRKIIDHFQTRLLGVTATPCRTDGKGLSEVFSDIVMGPTVRELIDRGFLVEPVIYGPEERLDFSSVTVSMGDYDKSEVADKVDKAKITGSAVEHYARICPNDRAVVFCVNVVHAERVAAEFTSSGYPAASIDGYMDQEDQERVLSDFESGRVKVLTSVDLIGEGFDIPAIACVIMLRPTMSTGLYLQMVGRALRPMEGKQFAIILDHVSNYEKHGFPDDEREWSLDGKKKKKSKKNAEPLILTRQCPECYIVHKPAPKCPGCGNEYVVQARELEEKEGSLRQITKDDAAILKMRKKQEVGRAGSLEALQEIERVRGYKKGWAKHVWDAKQKKKVNI